MNRCASNAGISVVILIRTDTTLDHSQKAEKVCLHVAAVLGPSTPRGKEVSWLRPGSTRQLRSAPPRGTTRNTSAISFVSARRLSRKCILGVIAIYAIVAVQGEYKDAAGDACPLQILNPSNSEVSMFSLFITIDLCDARGCCWEPKPPQKLRKSH